MFLSCLAFQSLSLSCLKHNGTIKSWSGADMYPISIRAYVRYIPICLSMCRVLGSLSMYKAVYL